LSQPIERVNKANDPKKKKKINKILIKQKNIYSESRFRDKSLAEPHTFLIKIGPGVDWIYPIFGRQSHNHNLVGFMLLERVVEW
jgi:hypothetical protein